MKKDTNIMNIVNKCKTKWDKEYLEKELMNVLKKNQAKECKEISDNTAKSKVD